MKSDTVEIPALLAHHLLARLRTEHKELLATERAKTNGIGATARHIRQILEIDMHLLTDCIQKAHLKKP